MVASPRTKSAVTPGDTLRRQNTPSPSGNVTACTPVITQGDRVKPTGGSAHAHSTASARGVARPATVSDQARVAKAVTPSTAPSIRESSRAVSAPTL